MISKVEVFLAITLVGAMTLMSFSKMILRNITGQGFQASWAVSFTEDVTHALPHMILLLGFIGASIGVTKREVIQMDVLKRNYPETVRAIITFISYLGIATVTAFYLYFALGYTAPEFGATDGTKMWLYLGYIPTLGLVILKSVFVLLNPQIEQDMTIDFGSED